MKITIPRYEIADFQEGRLVATKMTEPAAVPPVSALHGVERKKITIIDLVSPDPPVRTEQKISREENSITNNNTKKRKAPSFGGNSPKKKKASTPKKNNPPAKKTPIKKNTTPKNTPSKLNNTTKNAAAPKKKATTPKKKATPKKKTATQRTPKATPKRWARTPRRTPSHQRLLARYKRPRRSILNAKRKRPPERRDAHQPSKHRKLNTDSQPLTLKPLNPYPEEDETALKWNKMFLSSLRDSEAWVSITDPCAVIGSNFSDVKIVIFVVRYNSSSSIISPALVYQDLDNVGCPWMRALYRVPHNVLVSVLVVEG